MITTDTPNASIKAVPYQNASVGDNSMVLTGDFPIIFTWYDSDRNLITPAFYNQTSASVFTHVWPLTDLEMIATPSL